MYTVQKYLLSATLMPQHLVYTYQKNTTNQTFARLKRKSLEIVNCDSETLHQVAEIII